MVRREVKVAALQCALGEDWEANCARIEGWIREAASKGAQVVLPPELFGGPYFPREEKGEFFAWAEPVDGRTVQRFARLAGELGIALPISFFERDGQHYYNSVAVADADGSVLGVYRKSHIPDGPGYEEKFYFRPGDTGFKVFATRYARLGVGICWDQWFPEAARAMTLLDAELLLYPTAIGSEPDEPDFDSQGPWQRAMVGHAVCNVIPVVAANRIGDEAGQRFYGSSFVASPQGEILAALGRDDSGLIHAHFDLEQVREQRALMGFFRDRRPDLYTALSRTPGGDQG